MLCNSPEQLAMDAPNKEKPGSMEYLVWEAITGMVDELKTVSSIKLILRYNRTNTINVLFGCRNHFISSRTIVIML